VAEQTDVKVLIPRIRRAVEGAGAPEVLTDEAVRDLAADAIAEVMLYTGSVFGKQLVVTATDDTTGYPTEYATSDALTLPEQAVIATQAALDYFFHRFASTKVSERIADEAQTWEYTLSANLLRDQLKQLVAERDKALAALEGAAPMDRYESFIAVRDAHTSQLIEPWVDGNGGVGGQTSEDFRFGVAEVPSWLP
jgi:hypothetical protein